MTTQMGLEAMKSHIREFRKKKLTVDSPYLIFYSCIIKEYTSSHDILVALVPNAHTKK